MSIPVLWDFPGLCQTIDEMCHYKINYEAKIIGLTWKGRRFNKLLKKNIEHLIMFLYIII